MQFELGEKTAAITRKYGPIALNAEHAPIDVSYFGGAGWHEFSSGARRWLINDIEVTHTEWPTVFYCLFPEYSPAWTDKLTKWDFIDLDEAVEGILDRVQT